MGNNSYLVSKESSW